MSTRVDAELQQAIDQLFDPSLPLENRHSFLAQLRQQRPLLSTHLDRVLLDRDRRHAEALDELGAMVAELRGTTTRLTSAPLHEAVFVGQCELPDGRMLARVVSGSREMLLQALDDSILAALRPGERVLLASERNVILGRSESPLPESGECAVVVRWLTGGRLLLRQHDQDLVVTRAAGRVEPGSVKAGETVRLDSMSGFAMERVEPEEKSPYEPDAEATSVAPEALAGYDDIRDGALRRIAYAAAHPEVAARYGMRQRRPSILLAGPPGVGKTLLARVVAGELQRQTGRHCRIRKLNGAELLSPFVGETEQRIRSLVRELRESDDWSIMFLDEAEALARTRGGPGNLHSDRFLNSLLAELDGMEGRAPCILIAASNRLDMLDPAFRSRFATEIEVPRPRMESARAIFACHLGSDLPYCAGGSSEDPRRTMIDTAVAKLYLPNAPGALLATLRFRDGKARSVFARDLISGRLIEQICVDARERAFQRHIEGDTAGLRIDDLDGAVDAARDRLRATLTPANAHDFLTDIPRDVGVVAVDPAPRIRGGVTFIHEAAR